MTRSSVTPSLAGPVAGQPHPSLPGRGDPGTPRSSVACGGPDAPRRSLAGPNTPVTGGGPTRRAGRPVRRHPRDGYAPACRNSVVSVIVVCLLIASVSCGGAPDSGAPALEGEVTAFIGVTVVPMDRERVIADQTVVVHDGRIVARGASADTPVPENAQRIDGVGKYLMPGLAEMHGHLPSPSMPEQVTENVLFLYVANGLTTVRGMQGNPSQIELRDRIRQGELVGPQLFLGSPSMNGNSVTTVEDADRLVREYHAAGFDLLKVHEGLSADVYDAIAATANEVGIPFAGHVTDNVGLFHALESGQATIDHLDNYIESLVPEDRMREVPALRGVDQLLDLVDENRLSTVIEATLAADAGVIPTMVLWENGIFATRPSEELLEEWAEVRYMPPDTVQCWIQAVDQRVESSNLDAGRAVATLRRRLLKALHDGGVKVYLGTDSPQIFSVPGFSIHREMQLYVDVGLTPYDVLESGTRMVAEYFDAADDFGTVAVGRRADLLLLDGNPLDDVGNVARRAGVMVSGHWIAEEEIQRRLTEIADYYATQSGFRDGGGP